MLTAAPVLSLVLVLLLLLLVVVVVGVVGVLPSAGAVGVMMVGETDPGLVVVGAVKRVEALVSSVSWAVAPQVVLVSSFLAAVGAVGTSSSTSSLSVAAASSNTFLTISFWVATHARCSSRA